MNHTTTALKRHLLAPAVLVLSMLLSGSVLAQEAPDNSASDPIEREALFLILISQLYRIQIIL